MSYVTVSLKHESTLLAAFSTRFQHRRYQLFRFWLQRANAINVVVVFTYIGSFQLSV